MSGLTVSFYNRYTLKKMHKSFYLILTLCLQLKNIFKNRFAFSGTKKLLRVSLVSTKIVLNRDVFYYFNKTVCFSVNTLILTDEKFTTNTYMLKVTSTDSLNNAMVFCNELLRIYWYEDFIIIWNTCVITCSIAERLN